MSGELDKWIDQIVSVVTCDGRIIVGVLRGFDQRTNVILESSHERVYSEDAPIEQIPRGLLMLRGDNVACIGAIDESKDLEIDFETTRGEQLRPIIH